MQYSETRKPLDMRQNPDNTQNNLFQKRPTPKETPIKISSQLVMNPNLMDNNAKTSFNDSYGYNKTENNNNYNKNYYREGPLSQSFNVEAERENRLRQQREKDNEKPDYTEPNTDYYYKYSRTSSDVNDYNNRYTYNYRRDFDYIDFNKLSRSERLDGNNNIRDDNNDLNLKYQKLRENNFGRFEKPFEGPTPASRQRSFEPKFRKKVSDMEPFYKYKNVEYYGQRDPFTFGYDEVDDRYRFYSPFRSDYDGSRYGSYTYNYYLNAPMRGDISEDFKYPPQYYYRPKNIDIKPTKVFTNLF